MILGLTPAVVPAQIEKLTREVVILLMRLSLLRPIEMRKFVAVSRQYHANEAEAFSMWRTVVQSMKMSDQQQQVGRGCCRAGQMLRCLCHGALRSQAPKHGAASAGRFQVTCWVKQGLQQYAADSRSPGTPGTPGTLSALPIAAVQALSQAEHTRSCCPTPAGGGAAEEHVHGQDRAHHGGAPEAQRADTGQPAAGAGNRHFTVA
jgi:hypothetical protein